MLQLANDTQARLARIEAALVQSAGLLRCLEVEGIPEQWRSQAEEKREMLAQALLDAIVLQDVLM